MDLKEIQDVIKNVIHKFNVVRAEKVNHIDTELTLEKDGMGPMLWLINKKASWMISGNQIDITSESTSHEYFDVMTCHAITSATIGTDLKTTTGIIHFSKSAGTNASHIDYSLMNAAREYTTVFDMTTTHIDVKNLPIKDIKNHTASALSGTKKVIEILIGSTPYYFEVYPTKA